MKRTSGLCWYCKKTVNLYARNQEAGKLIEYAGKVLFEHHACSKLKQSETPLKEEKK